MAYIINAFQLPNEIVDRYLLKLSSNALKCYLVIVRKTIGWRKEFDAISTGQFSALTGIRKKDTIWAAIRELKELRLIEDVSIPGRPTQFKVVTQTYPENGDTPKNWSPRSEGAPPTPKKGNTLKGGTQNSSIPKPNKPTLSSSSSIEEENLVIVELVPPDPFCTIPEEGMDGISKYRIIDGVNRLVEKQAKDPWTYRRILINEIMSGRGRTLENIRSLPFRLPPGVNIFDIIEKCDESGVK